MERGRGVTAGWEVTVPHRTLTHSPARRCQLTEQERGGPDRRGTHHPPLGLRGTDAGQTLCGLTLAVPTPTPWASGFHAWHPVLLQCLFWPEVSLSQPQDIPQRENARQASGVRQAWGGWGQRGTPHSHSTGKAPGTSGSQRPQKALHPGSHVPWNQRAASYRHEHGETLGLGGLGLSPLTHSVLISICLSRPAEDRPAP